jgi:hypothetical protein
MGMTVLVTSKKQNKKKILDFKKNQFFIRIPPLKLFQEGMFFIVICSDTLMPCPFTGPKMFCASPNFLSQPKNLVAFSASSKTFAPAQKPIFLNANHLFVWHKMFVTNTIRK